MKKKLFEKCIALGLNVSITYQHINNYSVEIYKGYSVSPLFYTDGHLTMKKAVKKAMKFIANYKPY